MAKKKENAVGEAEQELFRPVSNKVTRPVIVIPDDTQITVNVPSKPWVPLAIAGIFGTVLLIDTILRKGKND